jgi:peptidase E
VTARERQILATSGGFLPSDVGPFHGRRGPIIDHALSLSGAGRPRLCYLGTATGDSLTGISSFYGAFAGCDDVVVSHLELFAMPNVADPASHLLAQDVIWVGGGSVANLLAVWRVHGLDVVMHEAWERGIVLAGVSAGSICWHTGGTTDSFGRDLRPVSDGLGLLPYSNGVHYDSEGQRRPLFQRLVGSGELPAGYATDDGVGLHYVGTRLHEVVSDRPGAAAYHVERDAGGKVTETRLRPRRLPASTASPSP